MLRVNYNINIDTFKTFSNLVLKDFSRRRNATRSTCPTTEKHKRSRTKQYFSFKTNYVCTRSLGALRALTSSWGPFGPRLRPLRPSGAKAARPTQVTHLSPKKIWQLSGNLEVRWWEILLEALDKYIWPCLRNTVRGEVNRIFCDTRRRRTGNRAF